MDYNFLIELLKLVEEYDFNKKTNVKSINNFIDWIGKNKYDNKIINPDWEAKEKGRTPESIINTLIVSMNRYAKFYSKSVIQDTLFASQEDFIYLINLKALGSMTKMQLINKNLNDKPTGIQIINRLLKHNLIEQRVSLEDKRNHIIDITEFGKKYLEENMKKIRMASRIVTGDLNLDEKMELIYLLEKLDKFHNKIFFEKHSTKNLLENITKTYLDNVN